MSIENLREHANMADVFAYARRQQIVILMYQEGRIDEETFLDLFTGVSSLNTALEERAFIESSDHSNHEDSPTARMFGLRNRLKPGVYNNE